MRDLTLRQIEVIRAVMMTGTISGAAALLNVSAPGISRLLKYTEETIGIRLFERKAGLFVPAVEASPVFDQLRQVHHSVENLNSALAAMQKGVDVRLSFASRTLHRPVHRRKNAAQGAQEISRTCSLTSIFSRSKRRWIISCSSAASSSS